MVGQDLLGERLVAGQEQAWRAAAGVGDVVQLQVVDDEQLVAPLAAELLEQVEHDVRLELLDPLPQRPQLVVEPQDVHVVPRLPQLTLDVVLRLERLDLGVGELLDLLSRWRDQALVDEEHHAALLHSGIHSRS